MEPITGTVAATGAATSASAASGGATVSAATAAKQADAIRRLAILLEMTSLSIFLTSQIVYRTPKGIVVIGNHITPHWLPRLCRLLRHSTTHHRHQQQVHKKQSFHQYFLNIFKLLSMI